MDVFNNNITAGTVCVRAVCTYTYPLTRPAGDYARDAFSKVHEYVYNVIIKWKKLDERIGGEKCDDRAILWFWRLFGHRQRGSKSGGIRPYLLCIHRTITHRCVCILSNQWSTGVFIISSREMTGFFYFNCTTRGWSRFPTLKFWERNIYFV